MVKLSATPSSRSFELWLIPEETELATLRQISQFRPQNWQAKPPSSSFKPHITLATFSAPSLHLDLAALLQPFRTPVVTYFNQVSPGSKSRDTVTIGIEDTEDLYKLYMGILASLESKVTVGSSLSFPPLELFDRVDVDDRHRLVSALRAQHIIKPIPGQSRVELQCKTTATGLKQFTGTHVELVETQAGGWQSIRKVSPGPETAHKESRLFAPLASMNMSRFYRA